MYVKLDELEKIKFKTYIRNPYIKSVDSWELMIVLTLSRWWLVTGDP